MVSTVLLAACTRSPVETLIDRSVVHLEAALVLMQEAKGDPTQLAVATMQYRAEHHADFVALRKEGEALLGKLDGEARRKVETEAHKRTTPIVARIETEAQKFPNPRRALLFVRPLIVQASPRPRTDGKLPWLPDVPDPPAGYDGPPPELPQGQGHGHGHAPPPADPTPAAPHAPDSPASPLSPPASPLSPPAPVDAPHAP